MKKKSIIAGAALAASFAALILCAPSLSAQTTESRPLIFPAESVASTDYNTGKVYFSLLKSTGNTMITHFRFTAGSRNARTGPDLYYGNRIRPGWTCRPAESRHGRGIRPITEKKRRPIPAAWPWACNKKSKPTDLLTYFSNIKDH